MRTNVLLFALAALVAAAGTAAAGSFPPAWDAYSPALAERATFLSAAAYSDSPASCVPPGVTVSRTFTGTDALGNPLFAYTGMDNGTNMVVAAFRGTENKVQLVLEALESLGKDSVDPSNPDAKVYHYFYAAVEQLYPGVLREVTRLLQTYPDATLLVTGHSLGGAMASLASTQLRRDVPMARRPQLYTFGQPRTGTYDYASYHDSLNITSYRVTHYADLVVHLPPCHETAFVCTGFHGFEKPYHHGLEVWYQEEMPGPHKLCVGLPHNEDQSCSDSLSGGVSISDHLNYFGIHVGAYCQQRGFASATA